MQPKTFPRIPQKRERVLCCWSLFRSLLAVAELRSLCHRFPGGFVGRLSRVLLRRGCNLFWLDFSHNSAVTMTSVSRPAPLHAQNRPRRSANPRRKMFPGNAQFPPKKCPQHRIHRLADLAEPGRKGRRWFSSSLLGNSENHSTFITTERFFQPS